MGCNSFSQDHIGDLFGYGDIQLMEGVKGLCRYGFWNNNRNKRKAIKPSSGPSKAGIEPACLRIQILRQDFQVVSL